MRNFLISKKINVKEDLDLSTVKDYIQNSLSQTIDISEITTGNETYLLRGSTGGLFDFIRKAKLFADIEMLKVTENNETVLKVFVKGSAVLSYSIIITYLLLFSLILFAGLLPGSIETDSENSTALDALVFLVIGYYIKTEIDKSLIEAEKYVSDTIETLNTRFGV